MGRSNCQPKTFAVPWYSIAIHGSHLTKEFIYVDSTKRDRTLWFEGAIAIEFAGNWAGATDCHRRVPAAYYRKFPKLDHDGAGWSVVVLWFLHRTHDHCRG